MTLVNLFLGTMRLWRTTVIWWPLGLFLYILGTGWLVGVIKETFPIEEVIGSMPQVVAGLFIGDNPLDVVSTESGRFVLALVANFLGTGPIYAALFALFLAPAFALREWDRGMLDTLLARPLTRRTYLLTRFVAFSAATTLVGIGIFFSHALAIGLFGGYEVPWRGLAAVTLAWCLLALAFGAFGFLIGVSWLSVGAGMGGTFVLLLAMLALNLTGLAWKEAAPIANLSFFKQWRPLEMLIHETSDLGPFLLYAGAAVIAITLAMLVFDRRDLA